MCRDRLFDCRLNYFHLILLRQCLLGVGTIEWKRHQFGWGEGYRPGLRPVAWHAEHKETPNRRQKTAPSPIATEGASIANIYRNNYILLPFTWKKGKGDES